MGSAPGGMSRLQKILYGVPVLGSGLPPPPVAHTFSVTAQLTLGAANDPHALGATPHASMLE